MKSYIYLLMAGMMIAAIACTSCAAQSSAGIPLYGGLRIVFRANVRRGTVYDRNEVIKVLNNRLNALGASNHKVTESGGEKYIVELPPTGNRDRILHVLQTTGQLDIVWFRDVVSHNNLHARFRVNAALDSFGREQDTVSDSITNRSFRDEAQIADRFRQLILAVDRRRAGATAATIPSPLATLAPSGATLYLNSTQKAECRKLNRELSDWRNFYRQEMRASAGVITQKDLMPNATASINKGFGRGPIPVVNLQFTPSGTRKFADLTRSHINGIIAIVFDGRVLSAPKIDEPISDGTCQISGGFANLSEAQSLPIELNSGCLPAPLELVEVDEVKAGAL